MPLSGMTATAPQTGVFLSAYQEKAPLQKSSVPITKSYITKENLQHAVSEALKEVFSDSDSEKTAYIYYESDVIPETYPSAPNGESLTDSTEDANVKANVVGFFDSFTGKAKEQFKSTFPNGYEFLEKVFNKKTHTEKEAFAIFDGLLSCLKSREYEKLPDFAKLCAETPDLVSNLEKMETDLEKIKEDFHDKLIYRKLEDGASREETDIWLEKRSNVENGLASLEPGIKSLEAVINSLKEGLPSEKKSFSIRMFTGLLSGIRYIIGFLGGVGAPLFFSSHLSNLGFETKQYFLKQKIREWENFKKPLDKLSKKNPLLEKEVINGVLLQQHRAQTQQMAAADKQADAIKALTITQTNAQLALNQQALDIQQAKDDAAAARKAAEDSNKEIKRFISSATPFVDQFKERRDSTHSTDSGYLSSSPEDAPISRKEVDAMLKRQAEQHALEKAEIKSELQETKELLKGLYTLIQSGNGKLNLV